MRFSKGLRATSEPLVEELALYEGLGGQETVYSVLVDGASSVLQIPTPVQAFDAKI